MRTRTHKYVEYQGRMKNLLFDLVADPRERHNLYGQLEGEPDQARLAQRLVELRRMHGLG